MSDRSGMKTGVEGEGRPICRVAYTINNSQPVVSTIIGDQPLFYMDFDISEDEEYLDAVDFGDLGILESELITLKEQITESSGYFHDSVYDNKKRMDEFLSDSGVMTSAETAIDAQEKLDLAVERLKTSRLANAYLDFAKEHCVELKTTTQVKDAFYDRKTGLILLNPAVDEAEFALLAVRELRRHWYHRQGALIHPLTFDPDNAILIHRSQQADLAINMVRVAWELQLSGYKDSWNRLEDSSLADLCRTFAKEAYLDFRTINNGFAGASVFEAWFLSDRCRQQDKHLIQTMLTDHQGYVFDLGQPMQGVTADLIARLGSMPYGKNYLAEHAFTIMNDPIFTDVRDRSNANFLWFIKFERSFKEAEQELQNVFEPAARGPQPRVSNPTSQDRNHGTVQKADIVTLYEGEQSDTSKRGLRAKNNAKSTKGDTGSADIIYLTRWSGDPHL